MYIIPRSFNSSLLTGRYADFLAYLPVYFLPKSRITYILSYEIIMPDNKTSKQIVPDMSEFEIDDVVSILMGSTPDSEIHIEYEDEGTEEESED